MRELAITSIDQDKPVMITISASLYSAGESFWVNHGSHVIEEKVAVNALWKERVIYPNETIRVRGLVGLWDGAATLQVNRIRRTSVSRPGSYKIDGKRKYKWDYTGPDLKPASKK